MRLRLLLLACCVGALSAQATTWALWPLQARWPEIDIVAVVNIGPVHELTTPEGIAIQSAEAAIEEEIYRRHPLDGEGVKTIRIYTVMPNGPENGPLTLSSGRSFVMMKMKGRNAFVPDDPWSIQLFDGGTVRLPEATGLSERSLSYVRERINELVAADRARDTDR